MMDISKLRSGHSAMFVYLIKGARGIEHRFPCVYLKIHSHAQENREFHRILSKIPEKSRQAGRQASNPAADLRVCFFWPGRFQGEDIVHSFVAYAGTEEWWRSMSLC